MAHARRWRRVTTREQFLSAIADKELHAEGLTFTIHSNGLLTGDVGGVRLTGDWTWRGEFFCRRAELEGDDLGTDCEVIEVSACQMRYTRDEGKGASSIVDILEARSTPA